MAEANKTNSLDWCSDSDDGIDIQDGTPKSKILVTPTDSGGSTPDSPASTVWDYTLPAVDQKTKDAANKVGLGIRKWRRKRRLLVNKSPTLYHLRNACYRRKLRVSDNQENLEPFCDNVGYNIFKSNQNDLLAEIIKCDKDKLSLERIIKHGSIISKESKSDSEVETRIQDIAKEEDSPISHKTVQENEVDKKVFLEQTVSSNDQETLMDDDDDNLFLEIDIKKLTQS